MEAESTPVPKDFELDLSARTENQAESAKVWIDWIDEECQRVVNAEYLKALQDLRTSFVNIRRFL